MRASLKKKFILWFEDLRKEDVLIVGGKCANLGELLQAGIPVPPGFAVTAQAYEKFITETGIAKKIYKIIEKTVTDINDPHQYEKASKEIRQLIESTPILPQIEKAIKNAYNELGKRTKSSRVFVAVRSSATAEDLPDASFAGQQETYLNVKGGKELVEKTVRCWSSLFTPRAIFYRTQKGFEHEQVLISVGVQKMVDAKVAGVTFTINPVTGEPNQIVTESTWGLGESVVSGAITPDNYITDKNTLEIISKKIAKKTVEYVRDSKTGKTNRLNVPIERQGQSSLTDEEIVKLTELANRIEKHYDGKPQDIEWAIDRHLAFPENIFIVQSRPETVWSLKMVSSKVEAKPTPPSRPMERKVVVKGIAAGKRAVGAGVAKIALTPDDASKLMEKGDILVTTMTNPDYVPFMKLSGAIITDKGGVTCHAAIVSRELGIPCIVATENGTQIMTTGKEYTVDARSGVVYEGIMKEFVRQAESPMTGITPSTAIMSAPITATKIYLNLGVPDMIDKYKNLPFDGIGLMRIEFILASYIGEHPMYLLETGQANKFINKLAEGIATVARPIQPRPVVVRFSDFKTNEYRELKGGEKYEIVEANPMLGWRGTSRYISKWYEKAFRLECKAIKKCREEWGLKNIWVMLPVVRTVWEAKKCLKIMKDEGLERSEKSRDFQIWFMAETPSIAIMADEFSQLCDGFSIGSNDMTQGILLIDRDSERLGLMGYFDERDPAIKRILAHLIRVAHQYGRTVSICGEGPSNLPDFTEFLVKCGIDSVSVNADAVVRTRQLVASIEQKILLEQLAYMRKSATSPVAQKSEQNEKWTLR